MSSQHNSTACMHTGEAAAPLLFGPKAKVRAALEMSGIPYTYVVAYGFASYWANGCASWGGFLLRGLAICPCSSTGLFLPLLHRKGTRTA